MTEPRRAIALLTNSEHGQANVILAVAYELLLSNDFNIHIISFGELAHRVEELNERVQVRFSSDSKDAPQAIFHSIPGHSMKSTWARSGVELPHKPGAFGAVEAIKKGDRILFGWDAAEYLEQYRSCLQELQSIRPVVAVADPMCCQFRDAIETANIPVAVLNATCIGILIAALQPKGAMLWKYPVYVYVSSECVTCFVCCARGETGDQFSLLLS